MSVELSVPPGLARGSFRAMGTTILVLAPTAAHGRAMDEVQELFSLWEQALSRFLPTSELSALNRSAGAPFASSELLFEVVATALHAARATGGLFDPCLLPDLVRIGYDRSFDTIGSPAQSAMRPLGGGGWRQISLDRSNRVIVLPSGVEIDLGGIAKGMAVDAALCRLAELGIECALVSAGGDLAVLGIPPGLHAWQIAVGDGGSPVVPLVRGALATSSVTRRRWLQSGVRRHHLLDPRTGEPTRNGLREVSIAASTCQQAEVAAKAVFVLGPSLGAGFAARHGLAARLLREDGREDFAGPWPAPLEVAA
jgi:thiamine biosynthesis lipoprotein